MGGPPAAGDAEVSVRLPGVPPGRARRRRGRAPPLMRAEDRSSGAEYTEPTDHRARRPDRGHRRQPQRLMTQRRRLRVRGGDSESEAATQSGDPESKAATQSGDSESKAATQSGDSESETATRSRTLRDSS